MKAYDNCYIKKIVSHCWNWAISDPFDKTKMRKDNRLLANRDKNTS